jgi:hypothetical protein
MGKFKEMDLLRQEREAFDADYPIEPTPMADVWVAWNSEDGFTLWGSEQQAILWSADGSSEWPVKYVMQKERVAPVQELTNIERHEQNVQKFLAARPALVHPVERIKPFTDTDCAYAYADGWNACVEHHKYIAKNAPEGGERG